MVPLPRTRNAVKGWHKGLDFLATRYRDSLWKTIENFSREEALAAALNEAHLAGGPPLEKKRRVMMKDDGLQSFILTYEEKEKNYVIDYLNY